MIPYALWTISWTRHYPPSGSNPKLPSLSGAWYQRLLRCQGCGRYQNGRQGIRRARDNEKHPALPARSLDIVKIKGGFECKPGPTAGVKYSDFFDSGEMLNVKLNVQQEFHLFCFNFPQNAITLKQVIRRYHKAKGRYGGTGTVSCVFLPLLVFHVKLMEFWRAIFLFFILKGSCSASGWLCKIRTVSGNEWLWFTLQLIICSGQNSRRWFPEWKFSIT